MSSPSHQFLLTISEVEAEVVHSLIARACCLSTADETILTPAINMGGDVAFPSLADTLSPI